MPGAARGQRQHYCDSGSGSFARANAHGAAECRDSFPHSQKPKASAARSSFAGEPNPVILNTQYSRTVIDFKANYEILCPRMLRHIVQRLLHRTVQRNLNFMVQFTKSHRQNQSRSHTCALAELARLFTNRRHNPNSSSMRGDSRAMMRRKSPMVRSSMLMASSIFIRNSGLGLSLTNVPRYSRRTIKPGPASSCNSRLMRLRSSSCACTRRRDSSKTSGTASATACIGVRPFIGDRRDTTAPRGQRECGSGTSRPGGQRLTLWLRQPAFYQASTRQCQLKTQKNQNGKMLNARGCLPYQIQSKGCCAISPQGSLMARLWSPFFPACPLD